MSWLCRELSTDLLIPGLHVADKASVIPADIRPPSTAHINVSRRETIEPADDSEMILVRVPRQHATTEKLYQLRDCAELIFKKAKIYRLPHANRNMTKG